MGAQMIEEKRLVDIAPFDWTSEACEEDSENGDGAVNEPEV